MSGNASRSDRHELHPPLGRTPDKDKGVFRSKTGLLTKVVGRLGDLPYEED